MKKFQFDGNVIGHQTILLGHMQPGLGIYLRHLPGGLTKQPAAPLEIDRTIGTGQQLPGADKERGIVNPQVVPLFPCRGLLDSTTSLFKKRVDLGGNGGKTGKVKTALVTENLPGIIKESGHETTDFPQGLLFFASDSDCHNPF